MIHNINASTYLWEQPNGRMHLVLDDGTLLLAGENIEPAPPPGYVRRVFAETEPPDG